MPDLPADWTPPPRSLLWAVPCETGRGAGLDVGCDCGTATLVIIEDADRLTGPREMSFTCECLSVHWFTVGPVQKVTGG